MELPQARWIVDFMENPKITWMITRGAPILGNPHMDNMAFIDLKTKNGTRMVTFSCHSLRWVLIIAHCTPHHNYSNRF